MANIIIAIVATTIVSFVIFGLWDILAKRKIRANQKLMAGAMFNEMEEMAKKLGYEGYVGYLTEKKGKEYAARAVINFRNFVDSFTARGPDS